MAKKLLFLLILPFALFAGELKFVEGSVKAHTEVFGDSTIDPMTDKIKTSLNMDGDIESITGEIIIDPMNLVSDNIDRDEHMYETLGAKDYTTISFRLLNITKNEDGYIIGGVLNLHGESKGLEVKGDIVKSAENYIELKSKFTIKMTDYNIQPPKMLFLTVRDEVDIDVDLKLKGE